MNYRCDSCGGTFEIKRVDEFHCYDFGLDNIYLQDIDVLHCQNCGAESPIIPRPLILQKMIGKAIALQDSSLTGKEIRFLRTHLGFKIREWAKLLRISENTLSRWESGDQDVGSQSDSLIRLLYIQILQERDGKLIKEPVVERIAAIQSSKAHSKVLVNMGQPEYYQYQPNS